MAYSIYQKETMKELIINEFTPNYYENDIKKCKLTLNTNKGKLSIDSDEKGTIQKVLLKDIEVQKTAKFNCYDRQSEDCYFTVTINFNPKDGKDNLQMLERGPSIVFSLCSTN